MKSINQVRHFYVVNKSGDLEVKNSSDSFSFVYTNAKGEKESSDIIKKDNILYAVKTLASKMPAPKAKRVTVKIAAETLEVGNEYTVKVAIKNVAGDNNTIIKYGSFVAKGTAADYDTLIASLNKNLDGMIIAAQGESGVTLTAQPAPYETGVSHYKVYDFDVTLLSEEAGAWAPIENEDITYVSVENFKNGPIIADMEWFHIGARGDMYRNFGHPYSVKTKTSADPTKNYDTLDIHYAYVGPNEGAQKSEKTITIAVDSSANTVINGIISTSGITVTEGGAKTA